MEHDHVDGVLNQWHDERPNLDVSAMAIIGRLARLERTIRPLLENVFAQHDLESWEFDVLATLRRSGKPYTLTAGQLLESMMIASGTMSNRLDRLEKRGFVRRGVNPDDRRVVLVALTPVGGTRVDEALEDHTKNENLIVGDLSERDRRDLARLLRRLSIALAQ